MDTDVGNPDRFSVNELRVISRTATIEPATGYLAVSLDLEFRIKRLKIIKFKI